MLLILKFVNDFIIKFSISLHLYGLNLELKQHKSTLSVLKYAITHKQPLKPYQVMNHPTYPYKELLCNSKP